MRVALINSLFPNLGIGGSEISTLFLAKGLQQLGHTVRVFSENDRPDSVFGSYDGIDVFRCGSPEGHGPNILAEPKLARISARSAAPNPPTLPIRIREPLLEFRPNVIHTAVISSPTGFWSLAREFGIPAIHTLRSYSLLCHRRMLRGAEPCTRQCGNCLTPARGKARATSNMLSGVVAISQHVMTVHRQAGWFADVQHRAVIPNSYALEPDPSPGNEKDTQFDLGYIGRLHETKGLEPLIEAVVRLNARRTTPVRLLIAGEGNPHYIASLKARFALTFIKFTGFMDQATFFGRVRFCVVPSLWYEPFGRVFVEALHHGVPVIGSARGGGAEVLGERTGWLFDPGRPAEFDTALTSAVDLAEARYRNMAAACLERAQSYTVEAIAQRYSDLYHVCLGVPA